MTTAKTVALGLMSGTSCDGVDAAIVVTDGEDQVELLGGLTHDYSDDLRQRLLEASQFDIPLSDLLRIEQEISLHHVAAVRLLAAQDPKRFAHVEVIGFHGHTVRHIPGEAMTWQIGNPWVLAHELQRPIVSDFRRCDVASGGQGAPLVAMFHRALFSREPRPTLVLNLGGVANVTWLGAKGEIIAGDTGPGCGLMDEWAQAMADLPHDRDGRLARAGSVDQATVEAAFEAPFFARPLPKSADRYDFDHVDVSTLSLEDGAATLCAVTAEAVFRAVKRLPSMPKRTWVTGGGIHHPVLMEMLAERLGDIQCVDQRGLNADTLEAECFGWLAVRHRRGLSLTIPETTGCPEPLSGGTTAEVRRP